MADPVGTTYHHPEEAVTDQPATDRTDPPTPGRRTDAPGGYLDYHRQTLRRKAGGLDTAPRRRAAPPEMTLGGMVKHLALVENNSWLRGSSSASR